MFFKRKRYAPEHAVNEGFSTIKRDINSLMQWIHYLKGKHDEHVAATESSHSEMYNHVHSLKQENAMLKERMRHMLEYLKLVHNEVKQLHEEVHSEYSVQEQVPILETNVDQIEEHPIQAEGLTPAENRFVSLLVSSSTPVTYSEISNLLGISYGTAKNRVVALKRKGVAVQFSSDSKGERRFFLPSTEKIRISGR